MQRIKLNKTEKRCLTLLNGHGAKAIDTLPRSQSRRALRSLEEKHLVKAACIEGGDYKAARLTRDSSDYLVENPKLRNPVDWKWIVITHLFNFQQRLRHTNESRNPSRIPARNYMMSRLVYTHHKCLLSNR